MKVFLTLIAGMDDSADGIKILAASPLEEWKRLRGRRPRITWMKTVLDDLEDTSSHRLR